MIETRTFCDWCKVEVTYDSELRDVHFLVQEDRVCNKCLKKVNKVKREIRRKSEERSNQDE